MKIVIPAPIREKAGFKPGTELEVIMDDVTQEDGDVKAVKLGP